MIAKRVTDSNYFLLQGSTELSVEPWSQAQKDSFLKKEFKVWNSTQQSYDYLLEEEIISIYDLIKR